MFASIREAVAHTCLTGEPTQVLDLRREITVKPFAGYDGFAVLRVSRDGQTRRRLLCPATFPAPHADKDAFLSFSKRELR